MNVASGSEDPVIDIRVTDAIGITGKASIKVKKCEGGKVTEIVKQGDDFNHDSGEWRTLHRVVDRKNHHYTEHIVDSTGEVVRQVDEPLWKHQGHGSARKARRDDHG
jgi:hypothetical protein